MVLLEKKFKYGETEYTMREMKGEEDLAFMSEFTNPITNKLNLRSLWMRRLSRCIVSPTMSEAQLSQLSSKEFNTLMQVWNVMNEPDTASFLEFSSNTNSTIR